MYMKVVKLLKSKDPIEEVIVEGWVRTKRDSKGFSFIELNDGSCLRNLQIIINDTLPEYEEVKKLTTGSAISVSGKMAESPGKGQKWEIQANSVEIISRAPEDYPLQKKRHTDEFLREIAHLRPRTNKYGAMFRIRSEVSFAIHRFFKNRDFTYVHTPIITSSDCEGAGKLFQVTTLDSLSSDYSKDFFGKKTSLTVSGQLSAEMFALALGNVYTFGPTFRAEVSNTRRHIAEFWMVEPEMAFCDLEGDMNLAEEFIKDLIFSVVTYCGDDFDLFEKFVDKNLTVTLLDTLKSDFDRIQYRDAIEILKGSKKKFNYETSFGKDLQTEHERFLTEEYFKKPVIVYNYPKNIKSFYMRVNDDDETVAAMDVLLPRIGEIIGGSQREERLNVLETRMNELNLSKEDYWWYLDSRKFGSVPHAGFGLGLERFLMFVTGVENIRDVIPFPRTPYSIEF